MSSMKVEGLSEIQDLLKKLPQRNQRKINRQSLRAGAKDIVKAMRTNVDGIKNLSPSGKTRYKKSIGVVTSKSRRHDAMVYVGPRYSGAKHIAPDAHLTEFGTEDRYTKDGAYRGRIQAEPFIRPAWDEQKVKAVEAVRNKLVEFTIKEAEKLR